MWFLRMISWLFICELFGSPIWRTGRFPPFCSPDFLRRLEGKAVHGAASPTQLWRLKSPDSSKKYLTQGQKGTFSTFQPQKFGIFVIERQKEVLPSERRLCPHWPGLRVPPGGASVQLANPPSDNGSRHNLLHTRTQIHKYRSTSIQKYKKNTKYFIITAKMSHYAHQSTF